MTDRDELIAKLHTHEQAILTLGRRMFRTRPGELDYAALGKEIAAVLNGLPAVRKAISALHDD